ncbi:MAG: methyltransferase [Bacteroidetes bacterium]|nr:methyltransferase [Bacteroidota bacterium]
MFEKYYSVKKVLREEGIGTLFSILFKKALRYSTANKISNYFPLMGIYEHPDNEKIPIYACYRDYIKPRHFLAHTNESGFNLFLRDNMIHYVAKGILPGAFSFCDFIVNRLKINIRNKKILEVGCGDGALTYVLAAMGAGEVHGIDLLTNIRFFDQRINTVKRMLDNMPFNNKKLKIKELEKKVSIFESDIQSQLSNKNYDIIISKNVLEHINDFKQSIYVMRDVLKNKGIMIHQFNPFFSETGGHEFCILDFPWGHVRLSREEIVNYLETYRNWEKNKAIEVYDHNFNNPKITLNEIDDLITDLGFKTLYSSEKRSFFWKPDSAQNRILAQCKRSYPKITWQDLACDKVIRFVRKE